VNTGASVRRLAAWLRLEARVEVRYRIAAVAALTCAGWTALLLLVPDPAAGRLGTGVLVLDTATFGAFFIPALYLYERSEGALLTLLTSPLRFGEYLGARIATLTGLSLAAAAPIAVVAARGRPPGPALLLLGVVLVSVLALLLAFILVLPHRTLTGYLTRAPLVIAPLLAAPLVHVSGIVDHPALYVFPTTGGADLIGLVPDGRRLPAPAAAGYLLVWIVGLALVARWRFDRVVRSPAGARPAPDDGPTRTIRWRRRGGWLVTFARVDLRSLRMESLLALLLAVPILLATALRLGYPYLGDYAREHAGLDLAAYASPVLAGAVLLHLPVIFGMVGALLVLDDIDERRLLLFRVTPVTLERYLWYRMGLVGLASLFGLLCAVPLSGLARPGTTDLLPAIVLAAAQAPLIMLTAAAFADGKVQGIGLLKVLSGVVLVVAVAPWWLPRPVQILLLVTPPAAVTEVQRAAEARDLARLLAGAAAGVVTAVVAGAVLRRRVVRRHASGA
jgi:fluoroquinolone transport system permease protein